MASAIIPSEPPAPEHLITVKVLYNDSNRRFKLPLKDLRAQVFPQKLRMLLGVPEDVNVILERYSDSASSYIRLDSDNTVAYKQLYRAAKAKLKLRIKATTLDPSPTASPEVPQPAEQPQMTQQPVRSSYLDTVLSAPVPAARLDLPLTTSDPANNGTGDATKQILTSGQPLPREFEIEQDKLHFPVISHKSASGMFCIDCNNCNRSIANEHFHCSICEDGDYDLCPQCVKAGASCGGEGHWLIKRVVNNGIVNNSTTETLPLRQQIKLENPLRQSTVNQSKQDKTVAAEICPMETFKPARSDVADQGEENAICNGCGREHGTPHMVRCNECEDYDLCLRCLLRNKHGHHPAHSFQLVSDRDFCLKKLIMARCSPGRQFKHAAECDGCEKRIVGIRHKCLSCPDWDYCQDCIKTASQTHPEHRFVPIYDAIAEPPRVQEIHYGIFCDGPLCKNKPAQSYITGVRYKCAVCHDTDFCANCEALPNTGHNRTHPLVKFKTPVQNVTVSTLSDDGTRGTIALGDQAAAMFSGTQEKHVVEEKPAVKVDASKPAEKTELTTDAMSAIRADPVLDYQGLFVRDTVTDGTKLRPNTNFVQTWTLYNPGPRAWPIGSDVRFVGGDTMFDVDANHPSSVESIRSAMESNKLTAPVEPGQSADFTVALRTPAREGTAISYWRLKLPNGMPIGHRLWCDIQVEDPESALEEAEVPAPREAPEPVPVDAADVLASFKAPATASPEISSSGMIFPKLEKESPETSTHEAAAEAPQSAPQAPTLTNPSEGDVLEDVESLALDDADADAETSFLTDEEYDVLDASDQEYLEAKQSVN